jgi:hypothetical protein
MSHEADHNQGKLSVIQRQRHALLLSLLQRAVSETLESETGFCLRFPLRASTWMILAEFVHLERLSGILLSFRLALEVSRDDVYLDVAGDSHALLYFKQIWSQVDQVSNLV